MPLIAKLDERKRLVGYHYEAKPKVGDVVLTVLPDLPTNATYWWDSKYETFVPVGWPSEPPPDDVPPGLPRGGYEVKE